MVGAVSASPSQATSGCPNTIDRRSGRTCDIDTWALLTLPQETQQKREEYSLGPLMIQILDQTAGLAPTRCLSGTTMEIPKSTRIMSRLQKDRHLLENTSTILLCLTKLKQRPLSGSIGLRGQIVRTQTEILARRPRRIYARRAGRARNH
jgi:hypothetical protein